MTAPAIRPSRVGVWSALVALYLIWGSTYLAIRIVVSTMPPFLSGGVRFLLAGAVLYAATSWRDSALPRPRPRQWRAAALVGAALLLGGNGGVMWAEQIVPSGLAALIIATAPLFMAALDRALFGVRLSTLAWVGILVGLAGVAVLLEPGGSAAQQRVDLVGAAVLLGASVSWSAGSVYASRADLPASSLAGTSMEMLTGGALLALTGLMTGELARLQPSQWSTASLLALAYLVVFGSLVAFSAYLWLLRVERTSVVSTYAYVNPAVAVLLGWAVLDEAVTQATLMAGGLIVLSVALVVTARTPSAPPNPGGAGREL